MNNKVHYAIAEIYKACDNIRGISNSFRVNDEENMIKSRIAINNLCDYIQALDKILHDELVPEIKKAGL